MSSDIYRTTGRVRGSIGPSSVLIQGDNITLSSTAATIVLTAGTVTDEVRIFLQTKGANTTEVAIGNVDVETGKGADVLKSVNDFWIQAINHSLEPVYVKADHADGAVLRVSYSRAL